MNEQFIYELLIVLSFGLVAGLISRQLRAPTLVGYLAAGAVLGQGALGWVSPETHEIEYLAEAGVFFLLFSIGLEFTFDELLRMRRHLVVGGLSQMLLTSLPAAATLLLLDFDWPTALFLAAAVAFSSTVLVFKSLSEAGHADRPHGRRAIGILLFQDAALVPLLLATTMLQGAPPTALDYFWLASNSILFIVGVLGLRKLLTTWLVPHLTTHRSPELVVLFSLVVLGGVTLFAHALALPPAVGAFAAGLSLGGNRWSEQIDALLLPFRETFAAVFFVSLGLLLDLSYVATEPLFVFGGIAAVIALKTAAASFALWLSDLSWRRAVGMGVGLAHVGEFAFVLLFMLARQEGLVSEISVYRFVAIGLGTLMVSPVLMKLGLHWIDTAPSASTDSEVAAAAADTPPPGSALVIGLGPVGRTVASQLDTMGYELALVDRSPINVQAFAQLGFRTLAGDATDPNLLESARSETFELVVVCVPDDQVAIRIVEQIRRRNLSATIYVRCRYASTAPQIKRAGANVAVSEEATASLELLAQISDSSK
ncbi:MAG: cation:proton antiporter [Aeoliella sp.]